MADCESELETNYESAPETSCGLISEAEPDAVHEHMCTPLESASEPVPVSMALNIEPESPPIRTGQAVLSFHHSASSGSSLDQITGQVQHGHQVQDAAGEDVACDNSVQHISSVSSSGALSTALGLECKRDAAQQTSAVALFQHSKRSCL